jgi:hypothetical protein
MRHASAFVLGLLIAGLAARAIAAAPIDPLPGLLADDWDDARRGAVLDRVRALGGAACATLGSYALARDPRAREHAVRAMADVGCDGMEDYRPFLADTSAWVVDALIDALGRRRIAAAVPFLLGHLGDTRRLVSSQGTWTVEEAADRALRRLTAQPVPFPRDATEAAADPAAWQAWYAAHVTEAPSTWIASGVSACADAIKSASPSRRITALETLALVGEPGRDLLVGTLRRAQGDLVVALTCQPEEPPRVVDEVPCILIARNATDRHVALAVGEPTVHLEPQQAPPPKIRSGSRNAAPAPPAAAASRAAGRAADLEALVGHIVDLAPGESLRREIRAGPVRAAGRYDVHAALDDLAQPYLTGTAVAGGSAIEATTVLRFEQ